MKTVVRIKELKCKRCGHTWVPRKSDVRQCPNPKCHSVLWDVAPCVAEPRAKYDAGTETGEVKQ